LFCTILFFSDMHKMLNMSKKVPTLNKFVPPASWFPGSLFLNRQT
jgi:hypothetical protein